MTDIHNLPEQHKNSSDISSVSQSDIRNPLSLLAHNQITASQFIRRGLYPFCYKQVPTHCLFLSAIEAADLLDLVNMSAVNLRKYLSDWLLDQQICITVSWCRRLIDYHQMFSPEIIDQSCCRVNCQRSSSDDQHLRF